MSRVTYGRPSLASWLAWMVRRGRCLTFAISTFAFLVGMTGMAATANAAGCNQATSSGSSGPADWTTYCWLDFTSYVDATARSGGQAMTFTLPDGSTLSFTATTTSTAATGLVADPSPAYSGAAFGHSAFVGVAGKPVLYETTSHSTVQITLSNITLTPAGSSTPTSNFRFVAADAESSNLNESLQFVTNGGTWSLLDTMPAATMPTYSGAGTNTFTITGASGTVGAYIVGSLGPTTVSATLVGGGLQAVIFAVQFASVTVNTSVSGGRVNTSDQFTYGESVSGTSLASATSSGTGAGPFTNAAVFLASTGGVTVGEAMATGSADPIGDYNTTLNCTNASVGSTPTAVPSGVSATSYTFSSLNFGDAISCTFANARYAPLLGITKSAPSPRLQVGVPSSYTLTVTNTGQVAATSAQVKDLLPANLSLVSATGTNWNCSNVSSLITCAFSGGSIATSGGTSTITVTVTPSASAAQTSVTNYASVDPSGGSAAPTPGASCTPTASCANSGASTVVYVNAVADSGTVAAGTAGTPITNVVANDTINGVAASLGTSGNATISQSGTWPSGISLNTSTGAISTTAAVAPGSYSVAYQLCDKLTPADCTTVTDTVTVSAAIGAVADTGSATAGTAGTPITNVVANDTINGVAAALGTSGNATISQSGTWPSGISLNTGTGAISTTAAVAPGSYSVAYQLCDRHTPSANCNTVTDTVTVLASIVPVADTGSGHAGTASTPIANVAINDTVNGQAATLGTSGNATVAQSGSWPNGFALNTSTGAITMTSAVPAGSYSLTYQLCDRTTPTANCATVSDTITVAVGVTSVPQSGTATTGQAGTVISNIAANGTVNGQPASLGPQGNATVATSGTWPSGITLDPSSGAVSVSAAVRVGTYSLSYVLCATSAPAQCSNSSVTITVTGVGVISISKAVDKTQVEIGDSVSYRIRVLNTGTGGFNAVTVNDSLPVGFAMIPGTVRISRNGAAPVAANDPRGTPGPSLSWTLGVLGASENLEIDYRVRVGVGAERGDGTNRAQAFGDGRASLVASAHVTVSGGAFDTTACIAGRIWVDCNGNGLQDDGEPGIPGVRVYLEDGTNLTSDENGSFSLCGLRPITHVLKVDPTTLPEGSRLDPISNRHAGSGDSQFVDLRFGALQRTDFAEGSCSASVTRETALRRKRGPVHAPYPPILDAPTKSTPGDPTSGADFDSRRRPPTKVCAASPGSQASSDNRCEGARP